MKIAIILGAFSIGSRPLDFSCLLSSPRGLTGTELCFVRTCQELEKRGHETWAYTVYGKGGDWPRLLPASKVPEIDESFDAAISINEPNLLIGCKAKQRIVWQMLNDFSFVQPGFDEHVDHYFGVSDEHTAHVAKQTPHPEKWSTIGLGCDPDLYSDSRVAGRVIYCSSPDRGLHWLLQEWPAIKTAVPAAHLRIFYHWSHDGMLDLDENSRTPQGQVYHEHTLEIAQRMRYIKHALGELKGFGVEHVGSVSRDRMIREMSEASVLAYPCDTVAFSEGFSVSILEAHASYTAPVITDADCLGGIYRNSGCAMTGRREISEWRENVIDVLRRGFVPIVTRTFAERHTWSQSADKLDAYLQEHR